MTEPSAVAAAPFVAALHARIKASAPYPALEEKLRGQWRFRRWSDIGDEVERLAAGLARLGVGTGSVVALDAEINGRILLTAAAALALQARLLSVPTKASREARDRVVEDPEVALVVGQGREVVAEWTAIAGRGRKVPIVFDHATAGGRSPAEGVVTYDGLRALGADAPFFEIEPNAVPAGTMKGKLWLEEATDWRHSLETLLADWVAEGWTLALPELLAAADRDRREAAPQRWLASVATLEQAVARLRDRTPVGASWSARGLRRALAGQFDRGAPFLRGRLRRLLGLRHVSGIEIHAGEREVLSTETAAFFAWLGVPVKIAGTPSAGAAPARSLSLALAGVAR